MRLRLIVLLLVLTALPAFAEPEPPPADPRDQEIRDLKTRLEQQQQQIDQLNEAVRQLREARQAPPAEPPSAGAAPEDLAPEDPGPEPPPAAPVQPQATTSGTGQQTALNPNISVIGLFGGQAGGRPDDDKRNTLFVEEVEVALQAPVDPSTRLDAFVSFPRNESPELEEAYATYLALPWGLQARGGLFRNDFGRINRLHTHELPQVDRPLPVEEYFGPEGLRSPGAEVSWLAPLPWYSKATLEVTSRFGETEEGAFALFPPDGVTRPLFTGRLENLFDLDEDTTLMLGLSGATSSIDDGTVTDSSIGGADLTLKWRPLEGQGQNLVWQSEALFGRQGLADPTLPERRFSGWYSFLNYQWNRNWRAGVRYDQAEDPTDSSLLQRRATALLEYIPSEWNTLRLQFSRYNPNFDKPFNEFRLQWNVVIGPHGAHKY